MKYVKIVVGYTDCVIPVESKDFGVVLEALSNAFIVERKIDDRYNVIGYKATGGDIEYKMIKESLLLKDVQEAETPKVLEGEEILF